MSGSSLTETDPALQIYEAQAIIVEKNQELQEKDFEIERLKQEIERLRLENNSNKNQELTQKVEKLERDLASNIENLSDRLETLELAANQNKNIEELSQKIIKLEQDLAASKNKNFDQINHLTSLVMSMSQLNEKNKLRSQQDLIPEAQNAVRTENKVEKLSGGQKNTSVLILGGSGLLNTIYLFDSKAQSWKKLSITLPVGMREFGAVVLNEEIYFFGGYTKVYRQDCYKLKNDGSWIKLASLNQSRSAISSSSLVYKGDIWVIGGYFGSSLGLNTVEKYDISQDKWTYMPKMNYPRYDATAAVFKDRIFVTGGMNKEVLKSVEMFDPKLQKWILFCDLPFGISRHTLLISNSTLSIFGGYSESRRLNSVWKMDIEDPEKKWTEKQSLIYPRSDFGIGKLSNRIIVFGDWGNSGETSEIFDGNEWIDGPNLPQKLSQFAYTSIPRSLEERFLTKFS